VDDVV